MLRHAIISSASNVVVNVVLWDGQSEWTAPDGHYVVNVEGNTAIDIGYSYKNGVFNPPVEVQATVVETPTINQLQEQLLLIQTQINALAPKV
jgi:hypothetical protein